MSKINLPIAELKPALAGISKIIGRRTTLPVLSNVRIDRTKDGWITLTSTDLDSFITVRFEEPVNGPQESVLVPYDDLQRITKVCNKTDVLTVEKVKDDKAVIQYPIGHQTAGEHLESLPVEEYPAIPKIKNEPVPIPNDIRANLLDAMDCASTDASRVILNGAYIDVSDQKCQQIVGTDGRHLFASNSFTLPLLNSIVIPNHKFLGWKEFNNDGEWQLRVQKPEKKNEAGWLQISSRRWRLILRQIEGDYPNWRQVIPNSNKFNGSIEFESAAVARIIQTIERMPDNDKTNHRIGIRTDGRNVSLVSHADEKPVIVGVPEAQAKGKEITIALNREVLIKSLGFGLCRLEVIDELSAMRFSDSNGRQIIVMPVRPGASPQTAASTQPVPAPESDGKDEVPPVHSEAETPPKVEQQERSPMPKTSNGHAASETNGSNGDHNNEKPSLDKAIEKIEMIKGSYREAIRGLNDLTDLLKQVQRDHKNSQKEVATVRSTLERLQTVRI